MSKMNQLLGVANNLADSFVSVTNIDFIDHIESLPNEKTKLFKIDLLKESIVPTDLTNKKVKETVKKYKIWFLSEIKKLKIASDLIEKVTITVTHKPGKSFGHYYTCSATIIAKGKTYTKKVISTYS